MDYNAGKHPMTYTLKVAYKGMPFDTVTIQAKTEHEAIEMARNRIVMWALLDSTREVEGKPVTRYKVFVDQRGVPFNIWIDASDEISATRKVNEMLTHHVVEVANTPSANRIDMDFLEQVIKQPV